MSRKLIINKSKILERLSEYLGFNDLNELRYSIIKLKKDLSSSRNDKEGILNIAPNGDTIVIMQDKLFDEIRQIEESHTLDRALYYLRRMEKSITTTKTSKINDINLHRWKEYENIITDSLWLLDKRDTSGPHSSWYWGNFIPQIPQQLMLRYTKKYEWVLDPFVGSGTTLLECQRLDRNGLGIELQDDVANKARLLLKNGWEHNSENLFAQESVENSDSKRVKTIIETGDSSELKLKELLLQHGTNSVQLIIMHPPYHDIIKFSDNSKDLSNADTTERFLEMFGKVLDNCLPILDRNRMLAVVIGDKYSQGEWIPLGFLTMNEVQKRGLRMKSIIVKNFDETTAKRNQKELWRYRALVGGFYIFKHEYIFIFKKC